MTDRAGPSRLPSPAPPRTLLVAGNDRRDRTMMAAMCAWMLEQAGLEPGFRLCTQPANFDVRERPASTRRKIVGGSAKAAPFVLDGDGSSPGSPEREDVVLVAPSFMDDAALARLAKAVPETGLIVVAARDEHAYEIVERHARCGVSTYAVDGDTSPSANSPPPIWLGAMVRADDASGAQPFDLFASGSSCGRFALRGLGLKDVQLAVGAIAACAQGFAIELEKTRSALATFEGLR